MLRCERKCQAAGVDGDDAIPVMKRIQSAGQSPICLDILSNNSMHAQIVKRFSWLDERAGGYGISQTSLEMKEKGMRKVSKTGCLGMVWWILALFIGWEVFLSGAGWARELAPGGKVAQVFDGDTILLESGERVRYLGIDSPELAHDAKPADCHGKEAREANASLVLHKKVALQYDREHKDIHGRLLAYVILEDGRCANAEILRGGYAYVYRTSEGFSRLNEFLSLQRDAIRSRRGMWGNCFAKPAPYYWGNRRSFVMHRPECPLVKAMKHRNQTRFQTRLAGLEEGFRPCRRCKP